MLNAVWFVERLTTDLDEYFSKTFDRAWLIGLGWPRLGFDLSTPGNARGWPHP
jgi:hypothetical protein